MLPVRTILHPTDFSETAECAYQIALAIARDHGARLVVLHVVATPVVYADLGVAITLPWADSDLRVEMERRLHERFDADLRNGVESRLKDGDAAAEILRTADEIECDLIVIGTHGRGGLGRLLLGSVAETVLRRAHCPVLTIKGPGRDQAGGPAAGPRETVALGDGA